jgi:16S rRNA U516 pseudouridylate synthase RsuA-like enzyme
MFHRLGCRLTSLHRESIGQLQLPDSLPVGAWRALTPEEIQQALAPSCPTPPCDAG